MTPAPYLKKESIIQKKKLNPWGDADLDGSPNQFDCNPFNPAEDGKIWEALKAAGRKVGGIAKRKVKEQKEDFSPRKIKEAWSTRKKRKELKMPTETRTERERMIELGEKEELSKTEKKQKRGLEKLREKKIAAKKSTVEIEKIIRSKDLGPLQKDRELKKMLIEKKLQAGKKPTIKQIKAYVTAEKKAKRLVATGTLLKKQIPKIKLTAKVGVRETRKILEAIRRPSTRVKRVSGAGDGRGRPVGPSGTYMIEGRPVYVGEYRKWQSEQKKLAKAIERKAIVVEEGVEEVTTQKIPTRRVLTTQEIQQMRIRQAQLQRPPIGNILDAPNIMKGELQIQRQPVQTPPIQTIEQEPTPPELEPIQEQPQTEPSFEEEEIV